MKINTMGVKLHFHHAKYEKGSNRTTSCEIKTEDGLVIGSGKAICRVDKGDNFSFKTGRKIALTRAIRAIESKELRKQIWNAYLSR